MNNVEDLFCDFMMNCDECFWRDICWGIVMTELERGLLFKILDVVNSDKDDKHQIILLNNIIQACNYLDCLAIKDVALKLAKLIERRLENDKKGND